MSSGTLTGTFFPFSAVVGMDHAKKAIMCALVNPNIRSILITGPPGAAKSTVSRSVRGVSDKGLINIPLNVTYEQLFGGIDLEITLKEGTPTLRKGLLGTADGNILYFDDANLADETLIAALLDSVSSGRVIIEREGISSSYTAGTTLIATMNLEERDTSDHILDRFDICAYSAEEPEKGEIVRRNLGFAEDPAGFCLEYAEKDGGVKLNVENAKRILPQVKISDDLLLLIAELCGRVGAAGHRGDISVANTAVALAALNGRDEVTKENVEEAAVLCLSHRRNYSPPPPPPENEETDEEEQDEHDDSPPNGDDGEQKGEGRDNVPEKETDDDGDDIPQKTDGVPDEMMFEIGEQFRIIDLIPQIGRRTKKTKSRMGKRTVTESCDSTGRYSGYRIPNGPVSDIALDATIREAAVHQKNRDRGDMAISVKVSDLREKVRERRNGCTILFLVDASGSIGVRRRMVTVKGAIESMLRESYVKRDRIGMMAFRRDSAEMILPPTKSVEYGHRKLEELPTGGKTPLGFALTEMGSFTATYSRHHPGETCFIVLMTDGRGNIPVSPDSNPISEAHDIAEKMKIPGVKWIVVDVGAGFTRFNHARDLAVKLEGNYFRLDEMNADALADCVKAVAGR